MIILLVDLTFTHWGWNCLFKGKEIRLHGKEARLSSPVYGADPRRVPRTGNTAAARNLWIKKQIWTLFDGSSYKY